MSLATYDACDPSFIGYVQPLMGMNLCVCGGCILHISNHCSL